jgi:hypothetical protein
VLHDQHVAGDVGHILIDRHRVQVGQQMRDAPGLGTRGQRSLRHLGPDKLLALPMPDTIRQQ